MSDENRRDRGLAIRTEVLGRERVETMMRTADDFNRPMQELANEYCWGWLWGRADMPRKTRSLINLALLSALNRGAEFKAHVKGALQNGCTRDEIREVLLQVAIYCGIPAGMEAHRLAQEVFKELDASGAS